MQLTAKVVVAVPPAGTLTVRGFAQDLLEPGGVVADRKERSDDRARRRPGKIHPLAHARVLLGRSDRARKGDSLDPSALEHEVVEVLGVGVVHGVGGGVGVGAPQFAPKQAKPWQVARHCASGRF